MATASVVPANRRRQVNAAEDMDFETTEGVKAIGSFEEMGIKDDLLRGIYQYGFEKPSAIQQRAVTPIIQGRDVIAQAQSGTGKTSMIALTVCQVIDTSVRECVPFLSLSVVFNLCALAFKIRKKNSNISWISRLGFFDDRIVFFRVRMWFWLLIDVSVILDNVDLRNLRQTKDMICLEWKVLEGKFF